MSDPPSITQLGIKAPPPAPTTHTLQTPCCPQEDGTQESESIIPFWDPKGTASSSPFMESHRGQKPRCTVFSGTKWKTHLKFPSAVKGMSWSTCVGSPVEDLPAWAENRWQQQGLCQRVSLPPLGGPGSFQLPREISGSYRKRNPLL